jgi:hypothetical protein
MVAAFLFPVAPAHGIGQVGIGFQVNVSGKGFTAVQALRTLVPAGRPLIGLQDKAVRVHGGWLRVLDNKKIARHAELVSAPHSTGRFAGYSPCSQSVGRILSI